MFNRKARQEAKENRETVNKIIMKGRRKTFSEIEEQTERRKDAAEKAAAIQELVTEHLRAHHAGKKTGVLQTGAELAYVDALSGMQLKVQDQLTEGSRTVTRWTVFGRHDADFMGLPASGKQVEFTGMTLTVVKGNEVTQEFHYWDVIELLRQMQAS